MLVAVAVTIIGLDLLGLGPLGLVRGGVNTVLLPLQRVAGVAASGPSTNADLVAENGRLRAELGRSQLAQERSRELDGLGLIAGGRRVAAGKVVAYGRGGGFERTVTVDVGSRDGVHTGMTVIADGGLVGRVTATSAFTAQVLRLDDPASTVGARLGGSGTGGSGTLGLVHGDGSATLRLELLAPDTQAAVGDTVYTGPSGKSTYAAGVPIGTIASLSPAGAGGSVVRIARVRPDAPVGSLDAVAVIVDGERTTPRPRISTTPSTASSPGPAGTGTPGPTAGPTPVPDPSTSPSGQQP